MAAYVARPSPMSDRKVSRDSRDRDTRSRFFTIDDDVFEGDTSVSIYPHNPRNCTKPVEGDHLVFRDPDHFPESPKHERISIRIESVEEFDGTFELNLAEPLPMNLVEDTEVIVRPE